MTWWLYLLLVNLYLGLFFGFYALLLRQETFFQLNRVYLVASAILSFLIPGIHAQWVQDLFITKQVQQTIYHTTVMQYQFQVSGPERITVGDILMYVYAIGAVLLAARFIWQLITLNKFMGDDQHSPAYAFFKKINPGAEENEIIEAHEQAHAGQWHSVDVLLIETIAIINWFNPLVFLYKKAIRNIHEFIADRQALKSGTSKKDYALLLLSQTLQAPAHQLVSPFFRNSMIKQRIMMLQKDRSRRIVLIKYCLSVPLFILMLVLSSATVDRSYAIRMINTRANRLFDSPANTDEVTWGTNHSSEYLAEASYNLSPGKDAVNPNSVPANAPASNTKSAKGTKNNGPLIISTTDHGPEYEGGMDKLYQFIGKNMRYPAELHDKGIEGRVIVSFVVETDGSTSDLKVMRDIGGGSGEEVIRVMRMADKWIPGFKNGKPYRSGFVIPVFFRLLHEDQSKPADTVVKTKEQQLPGLKGKVSNLTVTLDTAASKGRAVVIANGKTPVIYIVDGVKVDNISNIDPKNIESITVYKGKEYINQYGPMALNGVVSIKMKAKTN